MLRSSLPIMVSMACFLLFAPAALFSQGETTSAIVGQVTDATSAAIPGALIIITNHETGLQRRATADEQGRFNFPQLKPGAYSVKAEAEGFDPQQNENVISGLGQKQTVNFTLKVAKSQQSVEVSGEPPLINSENANTSTNLNASALENLPNPGGDLTYPLQFAAGALVNTAGSGNDFVGGTARDLAYVFAEIRTELFVGMLESDIRRLSRMMAQLHKNAVDIGSRQRCEAVRRRRRIGGHGTKAEVLQTLPSET
jgi:Carboxypeptidase regulatory-like domain